MNEIVQRQRALNADWPTALAILRIVRGWTQADLAAVSGLASGTLSDYERGKIIPALETVERILAAEGYSFAALDEATKFIHRVRANGGESSANGGSHESEAAARQREIEEVAVAAGRVVSKYVRLILTWNNGSTGRPTPRSGEAPLEGREEASVAGP